MAAGNAEIVVHEIEADFWMAPERADDHSTFYSERGGAAATSASHYALPCELQRPRRNFRSNKTRATSGDIDNEPVAVPTIAERTTQGGNVGNLFLRATRACGAT
jgi:hypothetical protein